MVEKEIAMPYKMFKDRYNWRIQLSRIHRFLQTACSEETIDHSLYPIAKWSGRTQKSHLDELGKSYADREESA